MINLDMARKYPLSVFTVYEK